MRRRPRAAAGVYEGVALLALRAAGVFDEVGGLGLLRAGPKVSERHRVDQWECSAARAGPELCVQHARDFERRGPWEKLVCVYASSCSRAEARETRIDRCGLTIRSILQH